MKKLDQRLNRTARAQLIIDKMLKCFILPEMLSMTCYD
uniref:Uncharacterized protein n=1 Tax=Tetranychus urticae TaxID=32264 RepID=T1K4B3_TETUR